jgi:hypothetical protein
MQTISFLVLDHYSMPPGYLLSYKTHFEYLVISKSESFC